MTQEEAQFLNWQIAKTWYADCPLEYNGVSIGRVLEYEMLRVIGRLLKEFRSQEDKEEAPHE